MRNTRSNKVYFRLAIRTALVALVMSVFTPIGATIVNADSLASTLTKTVTVHKPNGDPAKGVRVGITLQNPINGFENRLVMADSVTDTNGVAVVHIPTATNLYDGVPIVFWQPNLVVQPATDSGLALQTIYSLNLKSDEQTLVTLENSNVTFSIKKGNGDALGTEAAIMYPTGGRTSYDSRFQQVIDTSSFGLHFPDQACQQDSQSNCLSTVEHPQTDEPANSYRIKIWPKTYSAYAGVASNKFSVNFGSDLVPVIKTGNGDPVTPQNGIYTLKMNTPNLHGTLKSETGGALSFGGAVGGVVLMGKVNDDGSDGEFIGYGTIERDGQWSLFNPCVGQSCGSTQHFRLQYQVSGSPTIPTFLSQDFLISEVGDGQGNNIVQNIPASSSVIGVHVRVKGTGDPEPGNFSIVQIDPQNNGNPLPNGYLFGTTTINGDGAFSVPTGQDKYYLLSFDPIDNSHSRIEVGIKATSATPSLFSMSDGPDNPLPKIEDHTYWTLETSLPNLQLQIRDRNNQPVSIQQSEAYAVLCQQNGDCQNGVFEANSAGQIFLNVPQGQWDLRIVPNDRSGGALAGTLERHYVASSDGNSVQVFENNSQQPIPAIQIGNTNFIPVRVNEPNFVLQLINSNGQPFSNLDGYVGYSYSCSDGAPCSNYEIDRNGLVKGLFDSNGDFDVHFSISTSGPLADYSAPRVSAHVSNCQDGDASTCTVAFHINGADAAATPNQDGSVSVQLNQPNFTIRVVSDTGSPLQVNEGEVHAYVRAPNGDMTIDDTYSNNNGLIKGYLPDLASGTYELHLIPSSKLRPDSGVNGLAETVWRVAVSNGQSTFYKDYPGTPVTPEDGTGFIPLYLSGTNFKVHLTLNQQSVSGHLSACQLPTDAQNPNRADCITWLNGTTNQSGDGGLTIKDAGDYRLEVGANGAGAPADFKLHFDGQNFSLSNLDDTPVPTDVKGVWQISLSEGNFKLHVKDSFGNPTPYQGVNLCELIMNNGHEECGKYTYINTGIDQSSNAEFKISSGKRYSLQIFSPITSQSAQLSAKFTVEGNDTLTFEGISPEFSSGRYQIVLPLANFRFQVVSPSDASSVLTNLGYNICTLDNQGNPSNPSNCFGNGLDYGRSNVALADGNYAFTIYAGKSGAYADRRYIIHVNNGIVTFDGDAPARDGKTNRYLVSPSNANLLVELRDPADESLLNSSWIDVFAGTGINPTYLYGRGTNPQGQVAIGLVDGSYSIKVNPGKLSDKSENWYTVDVVNSVPSVKLKSNGSAVTNTHDSYLVLYASLPNVRGTIKDINGQSLDFQGGNRGVSVSVQKKSGTNWIWQPIGTYRNTESFGLNIKEPGIYRIVGDPNNFSDLTQSFSCSFEITDQLAVIKGGGDCDDTDSITLKMKAPNLRFSVTNPINSQPLSRGWVSIEKQFGDGHTEWVGNANLDQNSGLAGANIDESHECQSVSDKCLIVTIYPPQGSDSITGLAPNRYLLSLYQGVAHLFKSNGVEVSATGGGIFPVQVASANITGRVVDNTGAGIGSVNDVWTSVTVQRFNSSFNGWEWTPGGTQTNADGFLSVAVTTPGKYRLRLEVQGRSDVTTTYSPEFTVPEVNPGDFKKDFGDLVMNRPSVLIKVQAPGSVSDLSNIGVEIRKNGQQIDWTNTGRSGVAGISLPDAGTYEFIVRPNGDGSTPGTTAKSYKVTATKNGDGVVSATIASPATLSGGVYTLKLGEAPIRGFVYAPNGSTPMSNSQVIATDIDTGQQMWQYSTNTALDGSWAMNLPAGHYSIVATSPWGTSTYTSSNPVGTLTMLDNGVVGTLPAGIASATTFNINLKNPDWSGFVKSPDGNSVIPYAQVCFQANSSSTWNCTNSGADGSWSLAKPAGFNGFDAGSTIEIRETKSLSDFAPNRITGAVAVNAAIGLGGSGIVLRLKETNTVITVLAGGQPVPYSWVNFDRDNVGWLGGANTDANGVARINLDNPNQTFRIRADISNTSYATTYTSTTKMSTELVNQNYSGGVFTGTLNLAEPNLRGVLQEPINGSLIAAPFAWVDAFDETHNIWSGGSGTTATGFFSLNLPGSPGELTTYTVNANPPYSSSNSRRSYTVVVKSDGSLDSVKIKSSGENVSTTSVVGVTGTVFSLSLAAPSVTGIVVKNGSTPVANSWITPSDTLTNEQYWQSGTNSRNNGTFSMALAAGDYYLEANVPWGSTNLAKSAKCLIHSDGSTVTSGGACVQSDHSVKLELRAPNLTFVLQDESGRAIPFANVGVSVGNWQVWTQSAADGSVALFIDQSAIADMNINTQWNAPWTTGSTHAIHIWVDPPQGNTDIVRFECDSAVVGAKCASIPSVLIGTEYSTTNAGVIKFPAPNAKLHVYRPDGTTPIGQGAWITVNMVKDGQWQWFGASTDSNGVAAFNLPDVEGAKFNVTVDAPYNQHDLYSQKTYSGGDGQGLTLAAVLDGASTSDQSKRFKVGSPNLKITVLAPGGSTRNKWGWVGIEMQYSDGQDNHWFNWIGGYGLDDQGRVSLTLAADHIYRVTSNPQPGRAGAQTSCLIHTDASAVVHLDTCVTGSLIGNALSLELRSGNVTGLVQRIDGTPVVGAVVYANRSDAVDDSTAVVSSTGTSGRFGLQLDPAYQWLIKIFPVNTATDQLSNYDSTTTGTPYITPTGGDSVTAIPTITLAGK